ncbi:MAG TPA: CDP-alcohol phosphatidyltransferase family protein [Polyangiaceae bacterium]|nr:CDP-alcohol phosphatidyltransferase family protein [Polyangiaceae bacterium]
MRDQSGPTATRSSALVPRVISDVALSCLDHVARVLVALGVSAHAVTIFGVILAAGSGVLLSVGRFGPAALGMVLASIADALDGLVARRSGSASVGGALLDASIDRYQEFLLLGGLAVFLRDSVAALGVTLAALAGSFMVSYGSAKAEALGLPVPASTMRRAERAVCISAGVIGAALLSWMARSGVVRPGLERAPLLVALAVLAVVANASAIRRLRSLALARARVDATAAARADGADGAAPASPARVTSPRPAVLAASGPQGFGPERRGPLGLKTEI